MRGRKIKCTFVTPEKPKEEPKEKPKEEPKEETKEETKEESKEGINDEGDKISELDETP